MPVIVVTSRDGVQTFVLEEGKPLFLGRAPECDVVLPSSAVSRRHAVILLKNGLCGVKDLGSFNGTILNNDIIHEPRRLTDADVLQISSYVIRLHTKDAEAAAEEDAGLMAPTRILGYGYGGKGGRDTPLPLPRAMRQQLESNRPPAAASRTDDPPGDTQTFAPGKETSEFIKSAGENSEASIGEMPPTPAQEPPRINRKSASGYFQPFPIPETDDAAAKPPAAARDKSRDDLVGFEESPLAPLENIDASTTRDSGPTPFLIGSENFDAAAEFVRSLSADAEAVIPMESDYAEEIAALCSDAEEVIPLLDERPLVTTLPGEQADEHPEERTGRESATDADPDGDSGAYPAVEAGPCPDTAEYVLAADTGEAEAVSDTAEYQIAEVPNEPAATGTASASDSERLRSAFGEEGAEGALADDEFTDDFGDQPAAASSDSSRTAAHGAAAAEERQQGLKGKSSLSGIASITISPALMAAINTRLSLYSLLYDLVEERKRFREKHPELGEDVEAELDRQDREVDDLPSAEEADRQLQILQERKAQLEEAVLQAREAGIPEPPPPTAEMLAAEDLAVSQWLLIADSNRRALPAIYREAYQLAADEPLAKELRAARIGHGRLMGGAIYLLALEALATIANGERFRIARKLQELSAADSSDGLFGKLGRLAGNIMNRAQIKESIERLQANDATNKIRMELANREAAFMEKMLAREFRQVYKKAALRFIPDFTEMPVPVRAFLRHGVIGFSPWWLVKDALRHILGDCSENVVSEYSHRAGDIQVLYADEYLHAVSLMECTPSPDEELLASALNSVEWKTDRAYRRIVNARSYNELMEEMINHLGLTGKYLEDEAGKLEKRIDAVKDRGFTGGGQMFELQSEHQMFLSRRENIDRHIKRIQEELIPSILEAMEDSERRFSTGDLHIPDKETLIRREVDALFRIGRRLEGKKERFQPMAVREHYRFKADAINDRASLRASLVKMEEMDPGIFMRTIIPSKKRKSRVDLRMSPTVIVFPAAGRRCLCSMGREGMESGHLVVPTCFVRQGARVKQITQMLADFRWETSRILAGRDVVKSDTLVGAFTRLRWQARQLPKNRREKQMFFTDMSEKENWRRVYEVYLPDALNGARLLFQRNPELYEAIVGKYIDPPEGVRILRRGTV